VLVISIIMYIILSSELIKLWMDHSDNDSGGYYISVFIVTNSLTHFGVDT